MKKTYSIQEAAGILNKSPQTLRRWDKSGKLPAAREPVSNYRVYQKNQLDLFQKEQSRELNDNCRIDNSVKPLKTFKSLELFAGCGGLALGMEQAGIHCSALNEIDKWACKTLRKNKPDWNVLEGDVSDYNFEELSGDLDIVTGGFPCQAFSYAGKKLGLKDARGTLFYEFARAVKETQPKICIGENVKGLLNHDGGNTLKGMISVLDEIGYRIVTPVSVLKAIHYKVPQKRERLILVGIRKDINTEYNYPKPFHKVYNLKDALQKSELFNRDVPKSKGASYPAHKKEVLDLVPPKGYWRDLPLDLQKSYMKKSFYLGGGKTGMARRIGWMGRALFDANL